MRADHMLTGAVQARRGWGLTRFKCRGNNEFCSSHRYSDRCSCSFDFTTAGPVALAKLNPVVKLDKVEKI
uniref:AN1-type domain-containing protein n=1 Tax=Physcomitrium patens TaxID=3218 RepID=A0A2K1J7L3_PHYPA|nr:hypothetical protein PHYPA_020621 [Physcomitrium patens]